jgi:TolB protein
MRSTRRLAPFLALALVALSACEFAPAPRDPVPTAGPPASAGPSLPAPTMPLNAIHGRLAFSSETPDGSEDVFLLDLSRPTAPRIRLTDGPAREFDPDLSPDGERIVYRVNPDPAGDEADLWLMAADGADPVNLTGDPTLHNWSPAWSPDGTRIAFASTRDGGTPNVWTMAADGTDVRRVTTSHGEYPDWSPDGDRVVYAAPPSGSGRYDLWVRAADGSGEPFRLTDAPTTEFAPAWSPDGELIAYQSDAGSRWELWLGRADGSDQRRVSPDGEDGVWPAWSSDGILVWAGPRGLSFLDPATGAQATIEPAEPGQSFLSWGP